MRGGPGPGPPAPPPPPELQAASCALSGRDTGVCSSSPPGQESASEPPRSSWRAILLYSPSHSILAVDACRWPLSSPASHVPQLPKRNTAGTSRPGQCQIIRDAIDRELPVSKAGLVLVSGHTYPPVINIRAGKLALLCNGCIAGIAVVVSAVERPRLIPPLQPRRVRDERPYAAHGLERATLTEVGRAGFLACWLVGFRCHVSD